MELILISSSKLKVMLSEQDMKHYDITCENIDYGNTETRRAFWSILDDAKNETGFDAAKDRVFVQVYPSKSGGCEMYVTKLDGKEYSMESAYDFDSVHKSGVGKQNITPFKDRETKVKIKRAIRFDSMENMLCACARLYEFNYSLESKAYYDEDKNIYYLVMESGPDFTLKSSSRFDVKTINVYNFISEYGKVMSVENLIPYINEHCLCICEKNAVKILASVI